MCHQQDPSSGARHHLHSSGTERFLGEGKVGGGRGVKSSFFCFSLFFSKLSFFFAKSNGL